MLRCPSCALRLQQARDEEYLAKSFMAGLPSLGDRVQQIRQGKAATLSSDNERNFARSQVRRVPAVVANGHVTSVWHLPKVQCCTKCYSHQSLCRWSTGATQEEYIKGVSSWNFDIVALKAQADMEPDEPMLPTIKECDDDMTLSGIDRAVAAEFVAATMQAAASDAAAGGMSAFGKQPCGCWLLDAAVPVLCASSAVCCAQQLV